MATFDIYDEPKVPHVKRKAQSRTAKKPIAKPQKKTPPSQSFTAREVTRWIRQGRAYNP